MSPLVLYVAIAIAIVLFLIFVYILAFTEDQSDPSYTQDVAQQYDERPKCVSDFDCGNGGNSHICLEGICHRISNRCDHASDCVDGEECIRGHCSHIQCIRDYQCGPNEMCYRSRCRRADTQCADRDNNMCGSAGVCQNHKCEAIACHSSDDCPNSSNLQYGCVNSRCMLMNQSCDSDNHCPNSLFCSKVNDRGSCVQCDQQHQCPCGYKCVNGVCIPLTDR
jgi:hypothetical protein